MIFEQETIAFQILDVLFLDQGNTKTYNSNRNFDALSFRFEADTIIEAGGKETEITDNSICYFPSDVNYTRIAKKDKVIVIHFKTFNYHSNDIEYFHPTDFEKYAALFREILYCWNKKDISYKHDSSALLNTIFSELYKDNRPTHDSHLKIYPSIQYIEANCLKKDFSLQAAAEKSLMSEPYFRKLFKKEFNISPKKYVINFRMKYAASLIIAGYFTLQEIAEMCGYDDYKHFSVEFKKNIGVSPSKYTYNYDK
ncbi:MAG: helix-turn-helix transcriptional regulator [Clostridia bacterium]|nr:helix-turn-helix transcriptional regulator [Clostridia bacterium]